DWIANWSFARWALASQLLASTTPYVMPWVVALTHGEAETGMLGAATTLVGLSGMLLQGLANFLSPQAAQAFAHGGLPELRSVLVKTAALFAATLATISLVPRLGPLGAAIATLAGTATDAIVRLCILRLAMRELAGNGGTA